LGDDYDIWLSNNDGTRGEQIYDGTHLGGDPLNADVGSYDWAHPPIRYWEYPFLDMSNGFIQKGFWINNGPKEVNWGGTSNDEMMLAILMFVEDTTGLYDAMISVPPGLMPDNNFFVYPNPSSGLLKVKLPADFADLEINIFNIAGAKMVEFTRNNGVLDISELPNGIYFVKPNDSRFSPRRIVKID